MREAASRQPGEFVFTAVLLAGSAFLLWKAFGISGFQSWSSAGMFPMLAAATMLITLLIVLVRMVGSPPAPDAAGRGLRVFFTLVAPLPLLGGVVAVALYMLLLQPLGFLVSSFLFLVLAMRLFGSTRWGLNLGVSVASLAAIHLVFSTVFSVVLPKGQWLARFIGG